MSFMSSSSEEEIAGGSGVCGSINDGFIKVIFIPYNSHEALNDCLLTASALRYHGHNVYFLMSNAYKGAVEAAGDFRFIGYELNLGNIQPSNPSTSTAPTPPPIDGDFIAELPIEACAKTPFEQLDELFQINDNLMDAAKHINCHVKGALIRERPDIVVVNCPFAFPSLLRSPIPWVLLCPMSPHCLYGDLVPPEFSGFSLDSDRETWFQFRDKIRQLVIQSRFSSWYKISGIIESNGPLYTIKSPYLNIYSYPAFMDYDDVEQLGKNFFRMDVFQMQTDKLESPIPVEFPERPGKTILFMMGNLFTVGSIMDKFLGYMKESPYKFIVVKSAEGGKFEMSDNMWGENDFNLVKILPKVDLAVINGSNKIMNECLLFGKPMLVMPLVADQHDNAQRIQEKMLGYQLNPFHCQKADFIGLIERIFESETIARNIKFTFQQIQMSMRIDMLVETFEEMAADTVSGKLNVIEMVSKVSKQPEPGQPKKRNIIQPSESKPK